MYVRDGKLWVIKGRFSRCVELDEAVPWVADKQGNLLINLMAVSYVSLLF
jgi:hypothetical protein